MASPRYSMLSQGSHIGPQTPGVLPAGNDLSVQVSEPPRPVGKRGPKASDPKYVPS